MSTVIPMLRTFAAPETPNPWHGTTRRIAGIGRDALEIVPIGDVINIEAIAWRDGCEVMLSLDAAKQARAALDAAIAEAERHAARSVRKEVPAAPGSAR